MNIDIEQKCLSLFSFDPFTNNIVYLNPSVWRSVVYGQQQRWPTWGWEEPRVDQCADTDTWWVDDVMIFSDQCADDVVMVMVVVIIPVTMMTISMHRS